MIERTGIIAIQPDPPEHKLDSGGSFRVPGRQSTPSFSLRQQSHPNGNGRISNASYAASSAARGRHIGEALVRDCIRAAHAAGLRILQFNAVVESNVRARRLYERIGFQQLGVIPNGFRMKDGRYEAICPYYIEV